jgi:hypothetical protein
MVESYQDWGRDADADAAALKLLEQFPDDGATLEFVAERRSIGNDPAAALPFVVRARVLKPLDRSLRDLEWVVRVGVARQHALAKRWEEGRAEFQAAEALDLECAATFAHLAKKAIFEMKAGQPAKSEEFQKQAEAMLVEPTPLWLALSIESIRYRMTRVTQIG